VRRILLTCTCIGFFALASVADALTVTNFQLRQRSDGRIDYSVTVCGKQRHRVRIQTFWRRHGTTISGRGAHRAQTLRLPHRCTGHFGLNYFHHASETGLWDGRMSITQSGKTRTTPWRTIRLR
jgi:hypothetical protein